MVAALTTLQKQIAGRRLLIFDFDGTIADTSPLHARAFREVLAPHGIPVDYPRIAGMKTLDAMHRCIALAGRTLPEVEVVRMVADKQALVRQMIGVELAPLAGVDEFLHWARGRFRLCLVTSGSRGTVELALDRLGYAGWFEPILFADDVAKAKPDPEGLLTALAITGTAAQDALVFEDSRAGFEAARAAALEWVDARQNLWLALSGDPG